jgi:hypothetical protein
MTDRVEFFTLARPKSPTLQVPFLLMRMFEDLHCAMSVVLKIQCSATHIAVNDLWRPLMQIFQTQGDVKHHSQLRNSQRTPLERDSSSTHDFSKCWSADTPLYRQEVRYYYQYRVDGTYDIIKKVPPLA